MDPKSNNANNYFVSDQQAKQVEEKRRIGQLAAQLIIENDTVFLTVGRLSLDYWWDRWRAGIYCHLLLSTPSLPYKISLTAKWSCAVGSSNPITAFSPLSQQSELDNICPNKAFISAAGVSIEYGATCFNFDEILLKHRAMAKSQYKILVADHSKFGKIKPASIGTLAQFDALVTDRPQ